MHGVWYPKSCLLLLGALVVCTAAQAAPVSYTIDSSQSYLQLSGNLFTLPFTEQQPGSLYANYSGTLVGDLAGGVLTFSGGNTIVGAISPNAPFNPPPGSGESGNDVYGGKAGGLISVAFSDIAIDFVSGSVQDGAVPTVNIGFAGASAFRSTLGNGSLSGGSAPDQTNLPATLAVNGNVETVIIPIFNPNPIDYQGTPVGSIDVTGQIVATRVIPEPASWLLLLVGAGTVITMARARRR